MNPNHKLKAAIYLKGFRQNEVAHLCDLPELTMNRIVSGRRQASDDEQERIAAALNTAVEEVF